MPSGARLALFLSPIRQSGNFYALDAKDGHKLWGEPFGGAVGGGVIVYDAGHGERVAAATGLTEILWPTRITTAKVSVLGLRDH